MKDYLKRLVRVKKRSLIEKIVEAPAIALEETVDESKKIFAAIGEQKTVKKAEDYWHLLGPGLTTGAADDDPSGIATYSQAGAQYGFRWLWLASFTFPLMAIAQEMCARIGLVTGRGLAANIRRHFPRKVLYFCALILLAANAFNIGADLGAMAQAIRLFVPNLSYGVLVIFFALLSLVLQIFTTYKKYARYLKFLALILASYIFSALMVGLPWRELFHSTIIPTFSFNRESILLVTAVLGTTISPYLFFWQTSQEVEEQILAGKISLKLRLGATDEELKKMRTDIWSGMFFSNLVMFFIIAACAATLNKHGITNIDSAADAAAALRPLAGDGAYLLFALGIIGTGLLAIPVLAGSASYALAESFNWREGLYLKLKKAHAFYGVIIIATLLGIIFNFIGLDPIKALIYSAIANGIVAPIVLALIVLIASDKKIMGDRANSRVINFFGWLVTGLMALAGLAAIISLF
jgi:NRAMP (natural resistance-associated macrophage protein)-like metal ion transporter